MGRRRSGVGGKKERKREERKEYGRVGVDEGERKERNWKKTSDNEEECG